MVPRTAEHPNPGGRPGLVESLTSLGAGVAGHIRVRLGLLGCEGREAGGHLLRLVIVLGAALVFALLGYLLLVVGVVFLVSNATGWEWTWVTLGAAGIHLLAMMICLVVVRVKIRRPLFPVSLEELKKDTEWLEAQKNPPQPRTN